MCEPHGDEEKDTNNEIMNEHVFPSIGNTYLIEGNFLVNLHAALKHVEKDKSDVEKNIINLIDFSNVILKNYCLKDCDKH